jgi:hypothetical protein
MEMNGGMSETMEGGRNNRPYTKETYSLNGVQFLQYEVQSKRVLTKPVL